MDIVAPHTRSRMMAGIKGKDTKPELLIRKALYHRGFRYRLHARNLPGKPDLFLRKYNAVIFINGCFWHHHSCHLFKWPKTRPEFWHNKIHSNVVRDSKNLQNLVREGWRYLIVWECALKGKERRPLNEIVDSIETWLLSSSPSKAIRGKHRKE